MEDCKILITGGAGFIGSAVVRHILKDTTHSVINVDKLTYAGNLDSLRSISDDTRYLFIQEDICNSKAMQDIFFKHKPNAVMHLAAESHVDRSIDRPIDFINTNIIGTFTLLEAACKYYDKLDSKEKSQFRFHHISTDEVFGDLGPKDLPFTEESSYNPSSPYASSKAGSDHLVRAWARTYGLPILITNCSNNYGQNQFPEKLIPNTIIKALQGNLIPIYGDGTQIRDWLHVEDHARALLRVISDGVVGETYNIGGLNERKNIELVRDICRILEQLAPEKPLGVKKYSDLITFVQDRPGHDTRYAINALKINKNLGWTPIETIETGLFKTVKWYISNKLWWENILSGEYTANREGV